MPYGMKPEKENAKSLIYNAKKETKSDGEAGAIVTTFPPFHKLMVRVNSNSLNNRFIVKGTGLSFLDYFDLLKMKSSVWRYNKIVKF